MPWKPGPPKTASSSGTRDQVCPSADVQTAASSPSDPTATRPGPPTATAPIPAPGLSGRSSPRSDTCNVREGQDGSGRHGRRSGARASWLPSDVLLTGPRHEHRRGNQEHRNQGRSRREPPGPPGPVVPGAPDVNDRQLGACVLQRRHRNGHSMEHRRCIDHLVRYRLERVPQPFDGRFESVGHRSVNSFIRASPRCTSDLAVPTRHRSASATSVRGRSA